MDAGRCAPATWAGWGAGGAIKLDAEGGAGRGYRWWRRSRVPRYGMGYALVVLPALSAVQRFLPSVFVPAVFGCRQEPRVDAGPGRSRQCVGASPRHQLLKTIDEMMM